MPKGKILNKAISNGSSGNYLQYRRVWHVDCAYISVGFWALSIEKWRLDAVRIDKLDRSKVVLVDAFCSDGLELQRPCFL